MSSDTIALNVFTKLVRYYILTSTTAAGSGHPTSSLSATDLIVGLMFGGVFRFDADNPQYPNNDRLIFSKGHASPLLYALWAAAGKVSEQELMTLRKFGSRLEGHPVPAFPYAEAATGSLGQGLSVGVGMALNAKLDKLPYRTYVLLGDSEMAEGSVWEALQLAAHYKLGNLVGILDVNRLGQTGETMYGHDVAAYKRRIAAFGWETIVIDGHKMSQILTAYQKAVKVKDKPVMIIAKTLKGKGVSFIEDKPGFHGVALKPEQLVAALKELGEVDKTVRGEIAKPEKVLRIANALSPKPQAPNTYPSDKPVATRQAYGNALVRLFPQFPNMVVLDAEVSNSTFAETFKKAHPERFFEMYIAEQNMVGTALGLSRRGKLPFVSTFAAFLTRAFDQIRMSQYSQANIKFCGSHAGVSIGQDGPSQMGLEDIAMFRTILNSVVLYPSDAVSAEKLVEQAARHQGIVYLRTNRMATPMLYQPNDEFPIGGSKVLKSSAKDAVTVVSAGVTLFEALKAYEELLEEGITVRLIDLYCVKPIDTTTLKIAARETKAIITVEDHFAEGGIADAVREALTENPVPVIALAVRRMPKSGKPEELLSFEEISAKAIVGAVKKFTRKE
ncbi:MAG: transketolase [Patescibacteria group bacterium]|nr:transketolase [Patescibacteria group bacterium]